MITLGLPDATEVQPASLDPKVAAGRPFISTLDTPLTMAAVCGGHFLAGLRCRVLLSPTRAAGRPLMETSPDPLAMV